MQDKKTIFVTGATGNQGGAVARHLLKNGFGVRALTRKLDGERAKALAAIGAEVVQGDLDNPKGYAAKLTGMSGIFSVLSYESGANNEIKQGIALADLAKKNGVEHFVYSSVAGSDMHTGIPHWESKFVIENHIRTLRLPFTILRPTSLFENFLIPQVRSRLLKGKLSSPIDRTMKQLMMASDDIGRITSEIFQRPHQFRGRALTLMAQTLDQDQMAAAFSKAIGKPVIFSKLPALLTRIFLGADTAKMFKWINANGEGFVSQIEKIKYDDPGMFHLEDWIATNFLAK